MAPKKSTVKIIKKVSRKSLPVKPTSVQKSKKAYNRKVEKKVINES